MQIPDTLARLLGPVPQPQGNPQQPASARHQAQADATAAPAQARARTLVAPNAPFDGPPPPRGSIVDLSI